MNIFKRFVLRRRLKKAINAMESDVDYMCIALKQSGISNLEGFNKKSFYNFIKEKYPQLICYITSPEYNSWIYMWRIKREGRYNEVIKAKVEYLKTFL